MVNKHERMTYALVALIIAIVILVLMFVNVARANDPRVEQLKAMEPQLYEFIAANSKYNVDDLPEVSYNFKSQDQMNLIFHGKPVSDNENFNVIGLYFATVVILRDDYDPMTMSHIHLHELVHHVQMFNNAEFECIEERERDAYMIMDKYVEATGIGQKTDPFFLMFMRCRPELNGSR